MSGNKPARIWKTNVVTFILFVMLSCTGLISWALLPGGFKSGERGHFPMLRGVLLEIHEWVAVALIISIVIHILLHWNYVRNNLRKYGLIKDSSS